jgi:hypothetical protein
MATTALAAIDDELVDAALQAITDLAQHRKTGKQLGDRQLIGGSVQGTSERLSKCVNTFAGTE